MNDYPLAMIREMMIDATQFGIHVMRTLEQYLDDYGQSHRNPLNQMIHFFCVPAIFISSVGLFWAVPVGAWLGLSAELAPWVNASTIGMLPILVFYAMMSLASLGLMILWFAVSIGYVLAVQALGLHLVLTSAVIWLIAWAVQVYGHKVEGAKPSFIQDLLFLLIGPLFVMDEWRDRLSPRHRGAGHR
jgi:uncharacterized membrane protein YGL010W